MEYAELVESVGEHLGMSSDRDARPVVDATLRALGAAIPAIERRPLLDALPPAIAHAMRALPPGTIASDEELEGRVSESLEQRLGIAVEAAKTVCASLSEGLDADSLDRLRRHLPPDLAGWLEPPPERAGRPERPYRSSRRTLAEGRPGAGPGSMGEAHPIGQSGSVAREGNPHGDRKLSSAREEPSAGEGRTLATGRPGSRRPIGGV